MFSKRTPIRRMLLFLVLIGAGGCSRSTPDESDDDFASAILVPVSGVVTLDGKPLETAVVSFMPKNGPIFMGETDADGRYVLEGVSREGAAPGEYEVSVSYLVSTEGKPQGLDVRAGFSPPPSYLTAKEQLPRHYSDLGRTKLSAVVGPQGGTFDFTLDSAGMSKAAPKAPAESQGPGQRDEPAKSEDRPQPGQ